MVLDLEPRGDSIDPNLTLGFLADRKLTRGLRITAEVAEWAVDRPGPLATDRRHRIVAALPACSRTGQSLESKP